MNLALAMLLAGAAGMGVPAAKRRRKAQRAARREQRGRR